MNYFMIKVIYINLSKIIPNHLFYFSKCSYLIKGIFYNNLFLIILIIQIILDFNLNKLLNIFFCLRWSTQIYNVYVYICFLYLNLFKHITGQIHIIKYRIRGNML